MQDFNIQFFGGSGGGGGGGEGVDPRFQFLGGGLERLPAFSGGLTKKVTCFYLLQTPVLTMIHHHYHQAQS